MRTGTKIFYRGDAANLPGEGVISDVRLGCHKEPIEYEVTLADGRVFQGLTPVQFERHPGRRFMRLSDYLEERARALEAFQQRSRVGRERRIDEKTDAMEGRR